LFFFCSYFVPSLILPRTFLSSSTSAFTSFPFSPAPRPSFPQSLVSCVCFFLLFFVSFFFRRSSSSSPHLLARTGFFLFSYGHTHFSGLGNDTLAYLRLLATLSLSPFSADIAIHEKGLSCFRL
jgi:hypothetical protein